jgi:exodeoxyribonuclease VIII
VTLHFSDLKRIATSPAHYKYALGSPREVTRAMRIGTYADRLVFGGTLPPVFDGKRQGVRWEEFAAAHGDVQEIMTTTEADEAFAIAQSVRSQPLAMQYLTGRAQVGLTWRVGDVECSTRGVDCVGDGWISDLKCTNSAEPRALQWHARRMLWHAQLCWYAAGCRQNGIDVSKGLYLVAAESKAPYPATVLQLSPRAIEEGERCIAAWLERYRQCRDADAWPGYSQSVVEWEIDSPFGLEGLDDE